MRLRSQVVVAIARYLFTFMRWDRTRSHALSLSVCVCVVADSLWVRWRSLTASRFLSARFCSIPENLFAMQKHTLSHTLSLSLGQQQQQRSVVAAAAAEAAQQ